MNIFDSVPWFDDVVRIICTHLKRSAEFNFLDKKHRDDAYIKNYKKKKGCINISIEIRNIIRIISFIKCFIRTHSWQNIHYRIAQFQFQGNLHSIHLNIN